MKEKCEYCSCIDDEYHDHISGMNIKEYTPFGDGQIDLDLGLLGHMTISNYICEKEDEKKKKSSYIATYVDLASERIGDPFEISGFHEKFAKIKFCPFCGMEL